jgi:hypothetical protein
MIPRLTLVLLLCAAPLAAEPSILVLSNGGGVLDLSGAEGPREAEALPNPFRPRTRAPAPSRELPVAVRSVLVGGAVAAAILNDEVVGAGDTWEGLTLEAVGDESVDLRKGPFLLRLPVREAPVTLRLPW